MLNADTKCQNIPMRWNKMSHKQTLGGCGMKCPFFNWFTILAILCSDTWLNEGPHSSEVLHQRTFHLITLGVYSSKYIKLCMKNLFYVFSNAIKIWFYFRKDYLLGLEVSYNSYLNILINKNQFTRDHNAKLDLHPINRSMCPECFGN